LGAFAYLGSTGAGVIVAVSGMFSDRFSGSRENGSQEKSGVPGMPAYRIPLLVIKKDPPERVF